MLEKESFLKQLEDLKNEKDLNQIADLFNSINIMYGVTVKEACALAYYLIDKSLSADRNALMLREKFGIDINTLGIDGKLTIARAMVSAYATEVEANEQT